MDNTPRDVIGPPGLTRETLLALNAAASTDRSGNRVRGQEITLATPGEVTEDVDGVPSAVGEPSTRTGVLMAPIIARAEVERLGLTEEEIPNVRIAD